MTRATLILVLLLCRTASAQPISEWRALLAEAGTGARVALTRDGAWLPRTAKPGTRFEVHDASGARPQFLYRAAAGANLLLYVDRDALANVTFAEAFVTPQARPGAKAIGWVPLSGTRIDAIGPAHDGIVRVTVKHTWGSSSFEVRGYMSASAYGKIYDDSARSAAATAFEPDVTLPGAYELRDAPHGTPYFLMKTRGRVEAQVLERTRTDVLVKISQRAIGWVPAGIVRPIPKVDANGVEGDDANGVEGGGIEGGGIEGGVEGGSAEPKPTLPGRVPLYDAIDGAFVGETSSLFRVKPAETRDAWLRFELDTDYGKVSVWANPSAMPRPTQRVPMMALEKLRTSGTRDVVPDPVTRDKIASSGMDKVAAAFTLCINDAGDAAEVRMLRSSGFQDYDDKIGREMRSWKFAPYLLDGKPAPACTLFAFIYQVKVK